MSPILVLLWSKITVDLVMNPDLVNILAPPKNFTKLALYCTLDLFSVLCWFQWSLLSLFSDTYSQRILALKLLESIF